jgi:hypothetical protein
MVHVSKRIVIHELNYTKKEVIFVGKCSKMGYYEVGPVDMINEIGRTSSEVIRFIELQK